MAHQQTRAWMKRWAAIAIAMLLAVALVAPPASQAQTQRSEGEVPTIPRPEKSKISSAIQQEIETLLEAPDGEGARQIDVKVRTDMTAGELSGYLNVWGGEITEAESGHFWVTMPVEQVEALADLDEVVSVAQPRRAFEMGDVSESGDVTFVAQWHDAGLTGAGVELAVIDSGFDLYVSRQNSGDLPADLAVVNYCDDGIAQSAHGTAVAEIIHDTAPDAHLSLICIDDDADLKKAVSWAISNDIDVVNMSLGFFNDGRGDGSGGLETVAGQAGRAIDAGIVWINSAGNEALSHWKGPFTDSNADDIHEWDETDVFNDILLGPFESTSVFVKWDSWPTTALDLDVYLWDYDLGDIVAGSANVQDGSQPPTEEFSFVNSSGMTKLYAIVVVKFDGLGAPRLDLFAWIGSILYNVPAGSIVAPASHPDVVAVGATCWADDAIEPFSSRGPNIAGVTKPDVSAPDGVTTSVYGEADDTCTFGFTGTSAASPHVAGYAALVVQAHPGLSPAGVANRLASNTKDLGMAGPDNIFGEGRLRAFGICKGAVPTIGRGNGDDTVNGTSGNDIISAGGGNDTIHGWGGNDVICGEDGDDIIYGVAGDDFLAGGEGNDEIHGGIGDDDIYGSFGNDALHGDDGHDFVDAGPGNDLLTGSAGRDVLYGKDHADHLEGGPDRDVLHGGNGADDVFGQGGNDRAIGGGGPDLVTGSYGADNLQGWGGDDSLYGGPADDILNGGSGSDTCDGGDGSNTLINC